jgi:ankyrin repeat protein
MHDKFHMTPLMYACQAKDIRLVELLLQSKAKVRYGNNTSAPLHVVQSVECARAIIAAGISSLLIFSTMKITRSCCCTCLLDLYIGGDTNARDETFSTPLHHACGVINNYELVQLLIENKSDVNSRDKFLSSPLHKACLGGALKNVELLLRNGADANTVDDFGCSPLHIASKMGYTSISRMLVDHGANPNLINSDGFTPSQLAMCAED